METEKVVISILLVTLLNLLALAAIGFEIDEILKELRRK